MPTQKEILVSLGSITAKLEQGHVSQALQEIEHLRATILIQEETKEALEEEYTDFIQAVRGPMDPERKKLVTDLIFRLNPHHAYQVLREAIHGPVSVLRKIHASYLSPHERTVRVILRDRQKR